MDKNQKEKLVAKLSQAYRPGTAVHIKLKQEAEDRRFSLGFIGNFPITGKVLEIKLPAASQTCDAVIVLEDVPEEEKDVVVLFTNKHMKISSN